MSSKRYSVSDVRDADLNTLLCFALGFAFRMLAIRLGWKLPTFSYQQRWD